MNSNVTGKGDVAAKKCIIIFTYNYYKWDVNLDM